jgi:hypothetical protein
MTGHSHSTGHGNVGKNRSVLLTPQLPITSAQQTIQANNAPPIWGSPAGTIFTLQQGSSISLVDALRFTDPEGQAMDFTLVSGTLPTGVTLDEDTGLITASASATVAVSGNLVVTADDGVSDFWFIPSLQDERNYYTNVGWTRPNVATDEVTDFASAPGPTDLTATRNVHDLFENDDLWTWYQQQRRGYAGAHPSAAKVTTWTDAWLTYFKGPYITHLANTGNDEFQLGDYDHLFVQGLILKYHLEGDTAALTAAETIADFGIDEWTIGHDDVTPPPLTDPIYTRAQARWLICWTYLAEATGSAKWIFWRDRMINSYMGTTNWEQAPTNGLVQGGHYFVPRSVAGGNNSNGSVADYDAGRRFNSAFYYGEHAEGLWRAYLATGRADIRARLIQMARFVQYYAHNPADTVAGGPFTGSWYGHQNGGYYHREPDSTDVGTVAVPTATYDVSAVNVLVFGYKLTGDVALLNRAKVHFRQGTRWAEGQPQLSNPSGATPVANSLPLVGATEVNAFIDTRRQPSTLFLYNWNKGQLKHCYQLFENGGSPTLL